MGKIKVHGNKKIKEALKSQGAIERIRNSHEAEIKLANPSEFFKEMSQPVESKLYNWMKLVESKSEEMLDTTGTSRIVEINPSNGKWRWKQINSATELREMLKNAQPVYDNYMKLREQAQAKQLKSREDYFGFGGDDFGSSTQAMPIRQEYAPLIGTPFFKQMYLYDYWAMHSKCFWYKSYSGIARMIVDMTRNFVMGKGFTVQFKDQRSQDAWARYEERSNIQEEARNWCDDLTWAGENMLKKVFTPKGLIHKSFDPSTIWEIVTDPQNISDIKYYHQQYQAQYQLYGDKDTPLTKYIIEQIPPQLVTHTKVNVTSYEKRGRSDLLGALLYFKYYEDYTMAKLIRAKNEAAFIWDVEIDGSEEDVQSYIMNSQSIVDAPPGSENVHNKAVTRTAINPTFSKAGSDEIAKDILSYVAMSVSIPATYFGTFATGGNTKAGALVATEPVAKKMLERQMKMESLIRKIVKDVLIVEGLDPATPFEVTFPEIMEEDRSTKISDLTIAKQEGVISARRHAEMVAKELRITKYDYDTEQQEIESESKSSSLFMDKKDPQDLTPDDDNADNETSRKIDRQDIKKAGHKF